MSSGKSAFSINFKALVFDAITLAFLLLTLLVVVISPTDEQLLSINYLLFLGGGSLVIGGILGFVLLSFNIRTWGEQIFLHPLKRAKDHHKPLLKTVWGWQALIVLLTVFLVGLYKTSFSFAELTNSEGIQGALRLFNGIFSPDWSILPRAILNMIETIFMAFLATVLAIPLAFVFGFLAAKNVMNSPVLFVFYLILRTFLNFTRAIEALIWAIIFSVWVGFGPFAGMLALMVHSVASLAKQYSEMVESVNEGPIEGILSTGASRLQMVWFAIIPQVLLPFISFTVYRWDINVRMATIIGLVGGGGIGTLLNMYQGQAMWPQVGCIVFVIAVVVWLLDQASAYLREALK